jgi:sulfite exporter TauE/SafE
MYLWAAISIGFIGSLHCLGMCAPLLAAVQQRNGRWSSAFFHHGGRLLTYMIFGAVAGTIGQSVAWMGAQQLFSIAIGTLIVLVVLAYPFTAHFSSLERAMGKWSIRFSSWSHSLGWSQPRTRVLLGVANGLLPCGLVYLGVAGAANTFTPWDGALFMAAFGLGTLPALIVGTRLISQLSPVFRGRFRKLIPAAMMVVGLLLIVRGLNLDVPYLSPHVSSESTEITACDP